ncbi:MoaD/ThiS family protein [Dendrosporobacter sp. 1207_IL3150]|uniref:MoaD/ThiS family protein n=1 Tax=Dendrosporobacter sp. 1207_IL3150 TaxID=3084054 RepID=UPI002FD902F0
MIEVRLYATLRRFSPEASTAGVFTLTLPEDSSVKGLLSAIGISPSDVHLLMVNGASAELDRILSEGDRVGLFPPVGGG